jgi:hypothetical protein
MKQLRFNPVRTGPVLASVAAVLGMAGIASAGSTLLGSSGWRAVWDDSLDPRVEIDFIDVIGNTVFLQKSAEFTDPLVDGKYTAIAITFEQIGESSIDSFVIDDEIITNSTGSTWTGFNMKVNNNDNVSFDPIRTANSDGGGPIGFSIDPFTTAEFQSDNTKLRISGGLIESGEVWFPGGGGHDGQLWINMPSGAIGDFQTFTLKETPTATIIPGPAGLAVMMLVASIGARRRRHLD